MQCFLATLPRNKSSKVAAMTMSSFFRLNGHESDDRKLSAWQLHITFAALSFFIILLTSLKAYAGEPIVLKAESSLELTPVDDGMLAKQSKSEIFLTADDGINADKNYFIIKSTAAIEFNWGGNITSSAIKITGESLSKKAPLIKGIYSLEANGIGINIGRDLITIYKDDDLSLRVSDSYFTKTGKFAFSSIGEPEIISIGWERRGAVFSPYSPRVPEKYKNRAVGVLAYMLPNKLLAEALLLADDPDMASALSSPTDHLQALHWIDVRTGHPPDTRGENGKVGFADVAMRLRFHGSRIDLSIPVTKDDIDYKKLSLPKGLRLIPLD
jgi:hypothetical protein